MRLEDEDMRGHDSKENVPDAMCIALSTVCQLDKTAATAVTVVSKHHHHGASSHPSTFCAT